MPSVARQDVDVASNQKFVEGAQSVLVNDHPIVVEGSANAAGATIVRGSTIIEAENRQIARVGDALSDGSTVTTGSLNVFAYSGDYSHELEQRELTIPEITRYVASRTEAAFDTASKSVGISNKGTVPTASEVGLPAETSTTPIADCADYNLTPAGKFLKLSRTLDQVLWESKSGSWKETGTNPKIINCYKSVGFKLNTDNTAWCAGFAGWILKMSCLPAIKTLSSTAYKGYGTPVDIRKPETWRLNDIVVFVRPGGGHIGFFRGYNPATKALRILGGNQSDNLTESTFGGEWPSRLVYMARSWEVPPEYNVAVVTSATGTSNIKVV